MLRTFAIRLLAGLPFFLAFLIIQPIHNRVICGCILLAVLLTGILVLYVFGRWRGTWIALGILGTAGIILLIGSRPVNEAAVQADYLAALRHRVGVPYVWGGENAWGIDCSGLPRRAMEDALVHQGLTTLNGTALARAGWIWWHDASARELLAGYQGMTETLGEPFTINGGQPAAHPGDLAITTGGVHCMVYLDPTTIIQADPGRGHVVIDSVPAASTWYDERVRLVRWRVAP